MVNQTQQPEFKGGNSPFYHVLCDQELQRIKAHAEQHARPWAADLLWLIEQLRGVAASSQVGDSFRAGLAAITNNGHEAFLTEKKARLWTQEEATKLSMEQKNARLIRFLHRRAFYYYPIVVVRSVWRKIFGEVNPSSFERQQKAVDEAMKQGN